MLKSTLYQPTLNCLACFQTLREGRKQGEEILPACQTEIGCEIEDVAPDPRANRIVQNYLKTKISDTAEKLPVVREKILGRVGLLKDVDLLVEMDAVYNRWFNFRQQQERELAESRRR